MKAFNTLVRWIVFSSANPAEASLTIKGILLGLVPVLLVAAGLTHVNVGQEDLNNLIDGIAGLINALLTAISAIMITFGALRKLWRSIKAHQTQQPE